MSSSRTKGLKTWQNFMTFLCSVNRASWIISVITLTWQKVTFHANTYIKYLPHKAPTNPSKGWGGGRIEGNSTRPMERALQCHNHKIWTNLLSWNNFATALHRLTTGSLERQKNMHCKWWVVADATVFQENGKVTGSEDSKPRSVWSPLR